MRKIIFLAILILLTCQVIETEGFLIELLESLWSFFGFTIKTTWSIFDLTSAPSGNVVIKIPTTSILLAMQTFKLKIFAQNINSKIASMEEESENSQMSIFSSFLSRQTIIVTRKSSTNLSFLLKRVQMICIGNSGSEEDDEESEDVVDDEGENYSDVEELTTVGEQAEAFIKKAKEISSEILNYCEQFADLSENVEEECESCPTMEECEEVAEMWENVATLVEPEVESEETEETLLDVLEESTEEEIVEANTATTDLLQKLQECGECVNSAACENETEMIPKCSEDEDCKLKIKISFKSKRRILKRSRKYRFVKMRQGRIKIQRRNRKHWKNVFKFARKMSSNFNANIGTSFLSNGFVKGLMNAFGNAFFKFVVFTETTCEEVCETAEEESEEACEGNEEQTESAAEELNELYEAFAMQVGEEEIEECQSFGEEAVELQCEFNEKISECNESLEECNKKVYISLAEIFTKWVKLINALAECHDQCVEDYCPFLPFNSRISVSICFFLKRFIPWLFDTRRHIEAYAECQEECMEEMEAEEEEIENEGEESSETTENETEEAAEEAEECVEETVESYAEELSEIVAAYQECVEEHAEEEEEETPPCGTFVAYDAENNPDAPVENGYVGGVDLNELTAYVAYSEATCNEESPLPGYIVVDSSVTPGVYSSCSEEETFDDTTGFYLLDNPNLAYIDISTVTEENSETLLSLGSNNYVFNYGRVFYEGKHLLGRVRFTDDTQTSYSIFFTTPEGEESESTEFEVLTCVPTEEDVEEDTEEDVEEDTEEDVEEDTEEDVEEDTEEDVEEDTEEDVEEDTEEDVEEETEEEEPPCGTFVPYDAQNDPEAPVQKGYVGGVDFNDLTAYVAFGNVSCNGDSPLPGYIVVDESETPGVHISCSSGALLDEQTGYYLLNHPNLEYVLSSTITNWLHPDLVRIDGDEYFFGRVLVNGNYRLGRIKVSQLIGFLSLMYYDTQNGERSAVLFQVLKCKN